MSLEEKIRMFPASSGVYLMLDAAGEIIYVGKARSLRQRVRSYFKQSGDGRYQIKFLMAKVVDIEVVLTDTEKEALRKTITRFQKRFSYVETELLRQGVAMQNATLEEMDLLWERAKSIEREDAL